MEFSPKQHYDAKEYKSPEIFEHTAKAEAVFLEKKIKILEGMLDAFRQGRASELLTSGYPRTDETLESLHDRAEANRVRFHDMFPKVFAERELASQEQKRMATDAFEEYVKTTCQAFELTMTLVQNESYEGSKKEQGADLELIINELLNEREYLNEFVSGDIDYEFSKN